MSKISYEKQKLMYRLVAAIRRKGYSYSTEKHYSNWTKRFIRHFRFQAENEITVTHVQSFLTHLSNDLNVASSTQNQALNALVFLFREVLKKDPDGMGEFERAKEAKLMPVVLSREEVKKILYQLHYSANVHKHRKKYLIMTGLLYGCGLRLKECLRLRVKDIDFERSEIWIRHGKGKKDRVIPFPPSIKPSLKEHLLVRKKLHEQDLEKGFGTVFLPFGLERKYPNAPYEWGWQYVFPASKYSKDPRSDAVRRHHLYDCNLIRHIKKASVEADINKKLTTHSFRHSYATHLLEDGENIRSLQELLGHKDLKTTMIYLHVANMANKGASSPLEAVFPVASTLQQSGDVSTSDMNGSGWFFLERIKFYIDRIVKSVSRERGV